jgi:hypothetical protein
LTRRAIALLLIAFGVGLISSVTAIVEFLLWFHHASIARLPWQSSGAILALPFLLFSIGLVLLQQERHRR